MNPEVVSTELRSIGIAFPQVDVHLDPPVMDSLKALGRPAA